MQSGRDSGYDYYDDLAKLYPQPSQAAVSAAAAAAAATLTSAAASSSGLAAADPPAATVAPLGPVAIAILCLIVAVGCLAICALLALEVRDHNRTRHLYECCDRDCTEVVVVLRGEEADDAWQRHKKLREEKEAHGA